MNKWVDFELWCGSVQVMGYIGTDIVEEQGLQFFGADGLECYSDFSKTNPIGEVANTPKELETLWNWCLIEDFLSKVDIVPHLLEHQNDSETKITFGAVETGVDDSGNTIYNTIEIELLIKGDLE